MFKLGNDEDIDLEEDFLQGAFTTKKRQNHVIAKPGELSSPITGRCSFQLPSGSSRTGQVKPVQAQNILTNRANIIQGNVQKNSHCVDEKFKKVKETTNALNGFSESSENENFLDDINWDLCFEDEDFGQNDPPSKTGVTRLNDKRSVSDSDLVGETLKKKTSISTPTSVPNEKYIVTTPGSLPKQSPLSINRTTRKRKFPGPAGLLPTQQNGSFSLHCPMDNLLSSDVNNSPKLKELNDSLLLSSQMCENPFESQPWLQMQNDLDLNGSDSDLLKKFNIAWVLLKASKKQLPNGKVPVLILIIKSILEKGTEASVVFKDETGEMPGTIHRKIFEEYEESLQPGAVLVVRKVSIFSPTSRKHYLNVTPTNVVCLYSPNPDKPKITAPGVTHLRRQVREYALDAWFFPETNTAQEKHPISSLRGSPNLQTTRENSVIPFGRTNATSPEHKQIQQPSSTMLTNQAADEPDMLISDDDLDKFFQDLDDDFPA